MITVSVIKRDLDRLRQNMAILAKAGVATAQDLSFEQARLFQQEAVRALPPKSRSRSIAAARSDVRKTFRVLPTKAELFSGGKRGASDILWLYATPRALFGVRRDMYFRTYDLNILLPVYRQFFQRKAEHTVTQRGKQKVIILGKPVVSEHAASRLANFMRQRFGRLKASFAKGWHELQLARQLPEWIRQHIRTARGLTSIATTNVGAEIEFVSAAYGNTHRMALTALARAISKRVWATRQRVKDLWRSYASRRVRFRVRPGGRRLFT